MVRAMNRMVKHWFSAPVTVALAGMLIGCSIGGSASPEPRATACAGRETGAGQVFVFRDGAALASRVERTLHADGSEVLRGETALADARGGNAVRILEHVEIGSNGRLVYADVSTIENGRPARRVLLDAARGAIFVHDASGAAWQRVSKDAPWMYAGVSSDGSSFALPPTPIAAWTAARAAQGAESVRVIDASARTSELASRDQLVVSEEGGERVVVLGNAVATADATFVTSMERSPAPFVVASIERPQTRKVARR
jgi:hypothetical protein